MQLVGRVPRVNKTMTYWVSITGLDLKAWYHAPKFWYYSMPAMMAAQSAAGNAMSAGNSIDGTHHTLSAWEDREAMLRYMRSSNHVAAMRILDSVATGKVYGYESETIPSWKEAREMYDLHGRVVGAPGREARKREKERAAEEAEDSVADKKEEGGPSDESCASK